MVVDNNSELAQRLKETANMLLAVEKSKEVQVRGDVPNTAKEAMEDFKSYVVFRAPKGYNKEHVTIQDPWERNEGTAGPCRYIAY